MKKYLVAIAIAFAAALSFSAAAQASAPSAGQGEFILYGASQDRCGDAALWQCWRIYQSEQTCSSLLINNTYRLCRGGFWEIIVGGVATRHCTFYSSGYKGTNFPALVGNSGIRDRKNTCYD